MGLSAEDKIEVAKYEEELKRDWNRSMIKHIRKVKEIEKPSPQFPNTIEEACEDYFAICERDGVKPSVAGLSVALGVNRDTLLSWVRGEVSIECADVIKEYFSLIEVFEETALKDNRTNPVGGIFMMKNNHGYKDQVEHKIVDDRELTNEEIALRYRQSHDIIENQPIKVIDVKEEKPKPLTAPTHDEEKPKEKKVEVPF